MGFNLKKYSCTYPWKLSQDIISRLSDSDRIQASKSWHKQVSKVFKKLLGKILDVNIYLVNGGEIKAKLDMDFVEGGNDLVKHYIPKKEIWLDSHIDLTQLKFILFHEFVERNIMEQKGLEYEEAHNIANEKEKSVRNKECQHENV